MRNISDKSCRENNNIHFVFNNFFPLNRDVYEIMWENMAVPESSHNTEHAHCMLATLGFKHTLIICNTYCCSTATMVARTHLSATWNVHCLSC